MRGRYGTSSPPDRGSMLVNASATFRKMVSTAICRYSRSGDIRPRKTSSRISSASGQEPSEASWPWSALEMSWWQSGWTERNLEIVPLICPVAVSSKCVTARLVSGGIISIWRPIQAAYRRLRERLLIDPCQIRMRQMSEHPGILRTLRHAAPNHRT